MKIVDPYLGYGEDAGRGTVIQDEFLRWSKYYREKEDILMEKMKVVEKWSFSV